MQRRTRARAVLLAVSVAALLPVLSPTAPAPASAQTTCNATASRRLVGVAEGDAEALLLASRARLCHATTPIDVSATLAGGPDARQAFLRNQADFAVVSRPITSAEEASALAALRATNRNAQLRRYAYIPVAVSSVQLAHEIVAGGWTVPYLCLEAEQASRLFFAAQTDEGANQPAAIPRWDLRNPFSPSGPLCAPTSSGGTFSWPRLRAVLRTEANDETYLFTDWLSTRAAAEYTSGYAGDLPPSPNPFSQGARSSFPSFSTFVLLPGADNAARAVFDQDSGQRPELAASDGVVGLVGSSLVGRYNLASTALEDDCGNLVYPTPSAVQAAVRSFPVRSDLAVVADYRRQVPCGAYPLSNVLHLVVPISDPSGRFDFTSRGAALRAFVQDLLTDGQQNQGYVALPSSLLASATAQISRIPAGSTGGSGGTTTTTVRSTTTTRGNGGNDGDSVGGGGGGTTATTSATATTVRPTTTTAGATSTTPTTARATTTQSSTPDDEDDDDTTTDGDGDGGPTSRDGVVFAGTELDDSGPSVGSIAVWVLAVLGVLALVLGPILEHRARKRRA